MCYSLKKEGSLGGGAKVALQQIIPSLLSCVRLADFGGAGRTQLFLFETSRLMHRGGVYVAQYQEELLFAWSRHSNKSTPSFNCKIFGIIKSSSLASTNHASCATLRKILGLVDSSGNTLLGVHGSSSTRDFEVSSLERKRRGCHFLLKLSNLES